MKYYRVLPQYANKHTKYTYDKHNRPKWNGYFHIANELLTETEIKKHNYIKEYCEVVEIPKTKIYWFFGARFESVGA